MDRGFPAATCIRKTFDDQRSEAKGSEPAPDPLLALSQWKALQETNKKERYHDWGRAPGFLCPPVHFNTP